MLTEVSGPALRLDLLISLCKNTIFSLYTLPDPGPCLHKGLRYRFIITVNTSLLRHLEGFDRI